jgi:hypothetical protein
MLVVGSKVEAFLDCESLNLFCITHLLYCALQAASNTVPLADVSDDHANASLRRSHH